MTVDADQRPVARLPPEAPKPPAAVTPPAASERIAALRQLMHRHGRTLWTAALILPFVAPKFRHVARVRDLGTDGGHYVDVARHLAEGDGFTTSMSVLHQGFTSFPHPTSLYPAWPMLMAALLQVFSLRVVTTFVPAILFFVVLVLADRVGRRLAPAPWPWPLRMFDGGHALVMCFAAASEFFGFTSKPYTEALSFVLALLFLLHAQRLLAAPGVRAGAALGLWLVLLFYCRSHFVIFALALFVAGALELVLRVRRRDAEPSALARALALAVLTAALAWLPMQLWLATFLEEPGVATYFRFDRARSTSYLSEILPPQSTGLLAVLSDRLHGGLRAFDPRWRFSYWHNFGPLTYALPLALLALVVAPRDARARLLRLIGDARARLFHVYLAVLALGGLASIHAVHKNFNLNYEWYFASRHATICVLAMFLGAMFALRCRNRVIAALAALLLLAGTGVGYARAYQRASRRATVATTTGPLLEWMKALPGDEPVVIAVDASIIRRAIWRAPTDVRRRIGVHATYERTTLDDVHALSSKLGVRYFVVQEGAERALLLKKRREFRLVDTITVPNGNPAHLLVFAPRPKRLAKPNPKQP